MKRRGIVMLLLTALLVAGAIAPVFAQEFPNVSTLKAFAPEANFMSLPGYLRWLVFQQTSNWITYQEAARIVGEQLSQAGR